MYKFKDLVDRFYDYIKLEEYKDNDVFFIFPEDENSEDYYDSYFLRVSAYAINIHDTDEELFKNIQYDSDIVKTDNGRVYLTHLLEIVIANIQVKMIEDDYNHEKLKNKLIKQFLDFVEEE